MASPQYENGFTRIANEILETIYKCPFNGTQFRILLAVWRYTYGFNRKEHELSLGFISKAIEANKNQVKREIDALIKIKVLTVVKDFSFNSTREIQFNKDYEQWEVAKKITNTQYANQSTPSTLNRVHPVSEPVRELEYTQYANQSTEPVRELEYQERNNKKNIKESAKLGIEQNFKDLWKLYPSKKGLAKVNEKSKQAIYKLGFEIVAECIKRYKSTKPDWQAWQNGSTFFNSGYIDYLEENFAEDERPKDNYRMV